MIGRALALVLATALTGCQLVPPQTDELDSLLDEWFEFAKEENPLFATRTGDHRFDDRLPSAGEEDRARGVEHSRNLLERLDGIDRERLTRDDRITYDVFRHDLRSEVEAANFDGHLIPFTSDSGFHLSLIRLPSRVPLATARDYRNYISRLRAVPVYMEQHIELMRTGLERGFTAPRVVMDGFDGPIRAQVVEVAEDSDFYDPFLNFPSTVPESEREALRGQGRAAVMEAVVPSFRALLEFMVEEYIPGTRTTFGALHLPDGEAYYDYLVRDFTTLDISADEIHQIGLDEVARIRGEMEAVIEEVGFTGGFSEFLDFLRTDARFYAKTPEELLGVAAGIAKAMDGKLPSLFHTSTLPRQPYGVEPVPAAIAPTYTAGRYVGASLDGTRAGTYWVNTYKLDSRPLYVMESLTLHEAVPGHHLQNAMAQELAELPAFRRYYSTSAFGEGWGLYSEGLGLEAGFYTDPYSNFGRLTYEMWRACRLVVDTGIHAMGWTRDEAMDFLAANTALSLHEIGTEVTRYISWPGQALAYKMGELKIRELRVRAEQVLGADFDIRDFHRVVLTNGHVPLSVLESLVDEYIAAGASP